MMPIERTKLFVPGQLIRAEVPNYVILDPESGAAARQTESATWISEDGFYDHLVIRI
jgi:hypothetical protein